MPASGADLDPRRAQLDRILSSPGFVRNDRISRFLRFVVEQQLAGKSDQLKESVVGVEVFGRKPDYNPRQDAVVRTEASRLRTRLAEYYAGEGSGDPIIIELPKGGYAPAFRTVDGETGAGRRPAFVRYRWIWLSLALVLPLAGWWWTRPGNQPVAIAVLPLENLGHDPASDYLADGLTDELIRNLSILDGLAPRSRTSSFAFKGKPRNVREVGKQLGADYVLEGSVLREGRQLRINVQFIRVRDDFPLWVGRYDREARDAIAIQDEISRGIVNSLRLKLGRGRRRYETSVEAYDLYLRARALQVERGGTDIEIIDLFQAAIVKDPAFAPAYAGLAACYLFRSGLPDFPADELSRMRTAAEKAIQLDPLLAEAHDAQAMAYARDAQWKPSEKGFLHAIELDPGLSASRQEFVNNLLLPLGRTGEALRQMRAAEKTDPFSPDVQFELATVLLALGRYEEAADHCGRVPDGYSLKYTWLGRARLGQGRIGEAIQVLTKDGHRGYLGHAYARAGRRQEAEKLAADSVANPIVQAEIYAGLGDKDRTLEALDRSVVLGPVHVGRILAYPEFALLRGDPRLNALRRRLGLPD